MNDITLTPIPAPGRTLGQRVDRVAELLAKKSALFHEIHALIEKAREHDGTLVMHDAVAQAKKSSAWRAQRIFHNKSRRTLRPLVYYLEHRLLERQALNDELLELLNETTGKDFDVLLAAMKDTDGSAADIHVYQRDTAPAATG